MEFEGKERKIKVQIIWITLRWKKAEFYTKPGLFITSYRSCTPTHTAALEAASYSHRQFSRFIPKIIERVSYISFKYMFPFNLCATTANLFSSERGRKKKKKKKEKLVTPKNKSIHLQSERAKLKCEITLGIFFLRERFLIIPPPLIRCFLHRILRISLFITGIGPKKKSFYRSLGYMKKKIKKKLRYHLSRWFASTIKRYHGIFGARDKSKVKIFEKRV